jgi:transglutaminase-like putative cysteine protease
MPSDNTIRQALPCAVRRLWTLAGVAEQGALAMILTHLNVHLTYALNGSCHFQMRLRPHGGGRQRIERDAITVTRDGRAVGVVVEQDGVGQWLHRFNAAAGALSVVYSAQVHVSPVHNVSACQQHPIEDIPADVLPWLLPSRYCEADRLMKPAYEMFWRHRPGLERVQAIAAWVRDEIDYEVGVSDTSTTAYDTFIARKGVCRDFSHLCVAFCRALNIPARLVAGYALFDEPPQDFHAIFEVWLGRWVRLDPTELADPERVIAVAHGRDATDTAFATIYGPATMTGMDISMIERDSQTGATLARAVGQSVLAIA